MEAKSTDRKSFQITENGQVLGELLYPNLFFLKAEIKLSNSETYQITTEGIFGTSISVTKGGIELANLKLNWSGQVVLTFMGGVEYVLKAKGTFRSKFILENKNKEIVLQFDPQFDWSGFRYNYEISYEKKPEDMLLVLLGVYASNYFIAAMSGASAGIS